MAKEYLLSAWSYKNIIVGICESLHIRNMSKNYLKWLLSSHSELPDYT